MLLILECCDTGRAKVAGGFLKTGRVLARWQRLEVTSGDEWHNHSGVEKDGL